MIPSEWEPYHREDGELVGYLVAQDETTVVPVNLVGHHLGDPMDRYTAEQLLEEAGLSYLAEPWWLRHDDGTEQKVVILEIDADQVVVANADFALVVGRPQEMIGDRITLTVPTDRLRPA